MRCAKNKPACYTRTGSAECRNSLVGDTVLQLSTAQVGNCHREKNLFAASHSIGVAHYGTTAVGSAIGIQSTVRLDFDLGAHALYLVHACLWGQDKSYFSSQLLSGPS